MDGLQGSTSYDIQELTSASADKSDGSGHEGSHGASFDPQFSMAPPYYDPSPYTNRYIEPKVLMQLPHPSHDDLCLQGCSGGYNTHGFPRNAALQFGGSYGRPRFSTSSIPYPYSAQMDANAFMPPLQPIDNMYNIAFLQQAFAHNQQPGNSFNSINFGGFQTNVVPDDCASVNCSQISCSSQCCSTEPCNDESCREAGSPCDDLRCFESNDHSGYPMWEAQDWTTSFLHNQPCKHTNEEHNVAITLRDLGAPGSSNQPQPLDLCQLGCSVIGRPRDAPQEEHEILSPGSIISYQSPGSHESKNSNITVQFFEKETQHTCCWIVNGEDGETGQVCGQVFGNNSDLQQHLCDHHIAQMSSKTKYKCLWDGCSRKAEANFASRNKLRRHISTHTAYKPHICGECGQGFSAKQALEQHIRTHTGHKPYECEFCEKSFKQKSALTMHRRTHTGEKPLKCEVCGKRFCESSNLSKHRKIHNADYKFVCKEPDCGRSFLRHDQLKRHMEKHTRQDTRQQKKSKARIQQTRSQQPRRHTAPEAFMEMPTGTPSCGIFGNDQFTQQLTEMG